VTIPRIAAYRVPPPEQWPHSRVSFQLEPGRAALLVHDLQEYFLDFYDRSVEPLVTLQRNVQSLLSAFRAAGSPVVYTGQPARQQPAERGLLGAMWGSGICAAPHRTGIEPSLAPAQGESVLSKVRYSAFQRTTLEQQLREAQCSQLVVCGVYAHIGCLTTAVEAFMKDFEVFFVGDAMADFSEDDHRLALRHVANCCGTLLPCQSAVATLQAGRLSSASSAGGLARGATPLSR
jgi:bifunctional isochorismate lyase/aryl carrier protein